MFIPMIVKMSVWYLKQSLQVCATKVPLTAYSSFEFNFFDYPLFGGKGAPRGSAMVAYCWVGRWYVPIGCQYKKQLYLAPFSCNLRCKF